MHWLEVIVKCHEEIRNIGLVMIAGISLPFLIIRTKIASRQARTAEANHISEMFSKSIEQLGANEGKEPSIERRIGAIFALEKTAVNNDDYYPQVMEVLCAYVRVQSPFKQQRGFVSNEYEDRSEPEYEDFDPIREDIQIALTVIGRCLPKPKFPSRNLDLSFSNLQKANLQKANLQGANLLGVNFQGAELQRADLQQADLQQADLSWVKHLTFEQLQKAKNWKSSYR